MIVCPQCQVEFVPHPLAHGRQRFCSYRCCGIWRSAWRKRQRKKDEDLSASTPVVDSERERRIRRYMERATLGFPLFEAEPDMQLVRKLLRKAYLAWEADEDAFSFEDDIHECVGELRKGWPTPADRALLDAWDRWQQDPDHVLPPGYLCQAFTDWTKEIRDGRVGSDHPQGR